MESRDRVSALIRIVDRGHLQCHSSDIVSDQGFFFCCHLRQCSPCLIASIFVAKPGYIRLNFQHFFSSRFCSYASRRPQSFICRLFMVMSSFLFSHSGFIVLFFSNMRVQMLLQSLKLNVMCIILRLLFFFLHLTS